MNGLLVVDDEGGVGRYLRRLLEKDGYRIVLAENGMEALDIVRKDLQEIETVICGETARFVADFVQLEKTTGPTIKGIANHPEVFSVIGKK
jgi:CheY-like chemotaxis protein